MRWVVMFDDIRYRLENARHRSESAGENEYLLPWPETGGVKVLLEVALVYHLVLISEPVLIAQIELLNPAIVPDPFTTVLSAIVWLSIAAGFVWLILSGSFASIHRFETKADLENHLERETVDRRWFLKNGGLAVSGGLLAWVTYERFVDVFLHVIDLLVIVADEFGWAITIVDGLYVAVFLAGFSLWAIGIDRFAVGGFRRLTQRYYGYDEAP